MNEAIEQRRNIALDILKPSERELKHGFELHKDALVIEPYCLGLRAPYDVEPLQQLHDEGADPREFVAQGQDMSVLNWTASERLRREYLEAWEASGVSCTFQNAGEEGNEPLRLLQRLGRHTALTDLMSDDVVRVTSVDAIEAAHAQGKPAVAMALNGVPLPGEQLTVESELRLIRVFAQLGAKMMHLTYNRRNPIADGCGEPDNAGLSDFGHAVVKEMNRYGIIIDLAHTGWQSCIDAAKASSQPVVVSHSGVHALNAHVRCKPDNVIRAVLDTGGVIGVTNVPGFLGRSGDINALLDHIDYLAEHFGCDSIAIGTDRAYSSVDLPASEANMPALPKQRQRWESLWPAEHSEIFKKYNTPHNLQSMGWVNWPLFTVGMVQRGYSDDDIRKILGGNMLRVLRAVWRSPAWWQARES